MANQESSNALARAIYKVLRPMVRLLMRHGVSYRTFADIARYVYVDVAEQDFALEGRKISHARAAVLTGINRKDIAKLKERPHPLSGTPQEAPNPAARIITGWLNDRRFRSADGEPHVLDVEGGEPNFTTLVHDYSSDVPVRALLDELERLGAVKRTGDQVTLLVRAYVPVENMEENLRIFGTAVADLLRTMDHNIAGLPLGRLLQRTVSYDDIPVELLEQIRRRGRTEGEAFLLQVNEWLAACDRKENPQLAGSGRVRAGIGIYYLEHPIEDDERGDP